jgi:hypothetical protein
MPQVIEYYRQLLQAPQAATKPLDYALGPLALLLPTFVIAWLVAFIYLHAVTNMKKELSTFDRMRLAWSWGWCLATFVVIAQLLQLAFRGHVPSLWAALPYYVVSGFALLIAFLRRRVVKARLQEMMKLVQAR